ncbi:MAG: DUF5665 domain-containing protein [Desulfovibrio sp.]|nr:DUF5665 domain-containing protein [Desulfovibrio sp.]
MLPADPLKESELASLDEKKLLEAFAQKIAKEGQIAGLVLISCSKWQVFVRNFFTGMARGLGFALGSTLVLGIFLACLYQLCEALILIKLPFVTEWLEKFLLMLKSSSAS